MSTHEQRNQCRTNSKKILFGAAALVVAGTLSACAAAQAGAGSATCSTTPDPDKSSTLIAVKTGFNYIGSATANVDINGSQALVVQCWGNNSLGYAIEVDGKLSSNVVVQCDGKVQVQPVLNGVTGKHKLVLRALKSTPEDTIAIIRPMSC